MYSLRQGLSHGTITFDLVTLTLKFDLFLKNFNLGCYLVMVAARRASSSDNSYYCLPSMDFVFIISPILISDIGKMAKFEQALNVCISHTASI